MSASIPIEKIEQGYTGISKINGVKLDNPRVPQQQVNQKEEERRLELFAKMYGGDQFYQKEEERLLDTLEQYEKQYKSMSDTITKSRQHLEQLKADTQLKLPTRLYRLNQIRSFVEEGVPKGVVSFVPKGGMVSFRRGDIYERLDSNENR
jgi:hypothetical protein